MGMKRKMRRFKVLGAWCSVLGARCSVLGLQILVGAKVRTKTEEAVGFNH